MTQVSPRRRALSVVALGAALAALHHFTQPLALPRIDTAIAALTVATFMTHPHIFISFPTAFHVVFGFGRVGRARQVFNGDRRTGIGKIVLYWTEASGFFAQLFVLATSTLDLFVFEAFCVRIDTARGKNLLGTIFVPSLFANRQPFSILATRNRFLRWTLQVGLGFGTATAFHFHFIRANVVGIDANILPHFLAEVELAHCDALPVVSTRDS